MKQNRRNQPSTYVRILRSPGYSSLLIFYYGERLTFSFAPYLGEDYKGHHQYSQSEFLRTTFDYEAAVCLYLIAKSISDGKDPENQRHFVRNIYNMTLTFEYRPDENNEMSAYLTIANKDNNKTIQFKFETHPYKVMEKGQMVEKVIQSGVGVLVKTLNGYLSGIGANNHLNKFTDEELENLQTPYYPV